MCRIVGVYSRRRPAKAAMLQQRGLHLDLLHLVRATRALDRRGDPPTHHRQLGAIRLGHAVCGQNIP
jgi:hypothetical protein